MCIPGRGNSRCERYGDTSFVIWRLKEGQWVRGMKARRREEAEEAGEGGRGHTSQGHIRTLDLNLSAVGRGVVPSDSHWRMCGEWIGDKRACREERVEGNSAAKGEMMVAWLWL